VVGTGPDQAAEAPQAAAPAAGPRAALLFSFPVMLAFGLAVLMFLTTRERFNDPDLWWHLKVGESIWNTRSIPRADQYSFTTSQHPWIAHEWLAETSLYAAYRAGGYVTLWFWLAGFGSLFCIALYGLCSLYSGNAKVSLLGGLMGWFFGTVSLALRPLILGHLFLVLELILIHLGRSKDRRWFWGLPPLFALWVNCHGSHLFGLGVMVLLLGCSFLEFRAGLLYSERWDRETRKLLCLVVPLCVAALFVNPIGWRLPAYPLNLMFQQRDNLEHISEWNPLDFQGEWGLGMFAVVTLAGLLVALRRPALRFDEVLLWLVGSFMAVRHTRLVFVFGVLAAPVFCRLLADLWPRWDPRRDHGVINALMILVAMGVLAAAVPSAANLEQQVKKMNPVGAVEFIRRAGLSGPMLNDYVWGGYLIWALPEHKVFVDGRADLFVWNGVFLEYGRWSNLREDPRLLLEKYAIRFCLLRNEGAMVTVFPHLAGWKKVYADDLAVVYSRVQ
jgi:hypothetical protein